MADCTTIRTFCARTNVIAATYEEQRMVMDHVDACTACQTFFDSMQGPTLGEAERARVERVAYEYVLETLCRDGDLFPGRGH